MYRKLTAFLFLVLLTAWARAVLAAPLDDLETWFAAAARSAVAGCAHRTSDGITAYAPDASGHYKAAWLRDFAMMLEGDAVPHAHIVPNVLRFVAGVSPEGHGVDCIKAD